MISSPDSNNGRVDGRVNMPPIILVYFESHYNSSSIADGICKQGPALWCNSRERDTDLEPKNWQHDL